MSLQDIVVGLTVYLRSGSPLMTVRGIGTPADGSGKLIGLIHCVWVVDGKVVSGDFPAQCLQLDFPGSQGFMSRNLSAHHIRG